MLRFATEDGNALSGTELGTLSILVVNRFMAQVKWDEIVDVYLNGIASEEDIATVKAAVRAMVEGGAEVVFPDDGALSSEAEPT